MANVTLDSLLEEFVPKRRLTTGAKSVGSLLTELERTYPALQYRLRDEAGTLRRFIRIFVNGEEIGSSSGLRTPLRSADSVHILHSIQGG